MEDFWTAFEWSAYERDTSHLSFIEHGAYLQLLKHYYQTGKPLTSDASVLLRVCRAMGTAEEQAMLKVLHEFFTLDADGYHQSRVDRELAVANAHAEARRKQTEGRLKALSPMRRSEIAKQAAKARWNRQPETKDLHACDAHADATKMQTVCSQNATHSQLQSQRKEREFVPVIVEHSTEIFDGQQWLLNLCEVWPKNYHSGGSPAEGMAMMKACEQEMRKQSLSQKDAARYLLNRASIHAEAFKTWPPSERQYFPKLATWLDPDARRYWPDPKPHGEPQQQKNDYVPLSVRCEQRRKGGNA